MEPSHNTFEYVNLLAAHCPWAPLRQWSGLPNIKWCEETLCQVISEPSNTWSNIAYILVAFLLFFISRKEISKSLRSFSNISFWVGVTSFAFHATYAYATQIFDYLGIYLFVGLLILLNLIRIGVIQKEKLFVYLFTGVAGLTIVTAVLAKLGAMIQYFVVVLLLLVFITEYFAQKKFIQNNSTSRSTPSNLDFYLMTALIVVAVSFSWVDLKRISCDPTDHIFQGHAMWHIVSALAMFTSYFHYRRYKDSFI